MEDEGPESAIVLSSRARLARNLRGVPYANRAGEDILGEVVEQVIEAAKRAGFNEKNFFDGDDLTDIQKNLFIERNLMTPLLASRNGSRGVIVRDRERSSMMINEEDHLRIQAIRPGLDMKAALVDVTTTADSMTESLEFAFDDSYGFLTACPTNMGSGLRLSVLIHLPSLVLTKEIQRVIRSASQLRLAVRGYRGEGSDVVGNFFQISNQVTMGKTEDEIEQELVSVVARIIDYEKKAADMLFKNARSQTEDKIWRSIGILKTARVMSSHEFMNVCSVVRLGILLGIVGTITVRQLNELLIQTQPGHLQETLKRELTPLDRDIARADIVRERLVDASL